jgi:predicted DNA-binding transcriptional regulator AlpA
MKKIVHDGLLPDPGTESIRSIRLRDVARLIGFAPDTVDSWVRQGKFPRPFVASPGSPKLFRVRDVEVWIEKRTRARDTKPTRRGKLRQYSEHE